MAKISTKAAVAESTKAERDRNSKARKKREEKHEAEVAACMAELTMVRVTMGVTSLTAPVIGYGVAMIHEAADDGGVDLEIGDSGLGYVTLVSLIGSLVALGASDGMVGVGIATVGGQMAATDTGVIKIKKNYGD